jgi:hypothetical protein
VHHDVSSETGQLRLSGGMPPLLPELAAVLPAAPDLMDRLVTEFAPTAATLSTPRARLSCASTGHAAGDAANGHDAAHAALP